MRRKNEIIFILSVILLLPLIAFPQGIIIKQGGYIKVPQGNALHEDENIILANKCGLHSHGMVRLHGDFINQNNIPCVLDTGQVILEGTSQQKIGGAISFDNLAVNNITGIILNHGITISKRLSLNTGNIILGNYNLLLEPYTVIAGNPSINSMIIATGSGQLCRRILTPGTFSFPVGDQTGVADYSPAVISFSSGVFGNSSVIGVNLVNSKYPDPNIQNNFLKRYWTVTSENITGFTSNAQFYYNASDVTGVESTLLCQKVAPAPVAVFSPTDTLNHILSAGGLNSFGSFSGAEAPCYLLNAVASVVNNVSCYGASNGTATVTVSGGTGAYTYLWSTLPVQTTQTATGLSAGIYTVMVTDALGCSKLSGITISQPPQWWASLNGPNSACQNVPGYNYTTETGMSNYSWLVSPGGIIISGGGAADHWVNVNWTTTGANQITVNYTNTNGCTAFSATTLNVIVNPLPVPTITGPGTACMLSAGNLYATQPGMTGYTWLVSPGGTITSGAGTSAITVTWNTTGGQYVSVNYTNTDGCSAASPVALPVTIYPLPAPTISGTPTVCTGNTNTYATQSGMSNYNWNVSSGGTVTAGGTSTSNTITINWVNQGPQTISINYTSPNGCSASTPTVYPVTVNPTPLPTIISSGNPCANNTPEDYYTQTGMTNYTWSVSSGGTILTGQGTSHIQVGWTVPGPGTITVNYTGTTGCPSTTPGSYSVVVNALPSPAGPITGPQQVCAGTTGLFYSVPPITNATSYLWELPAGATITSGAGTPDVTVDFSLNSISGDIKVRGNNFCGDGISSTLAVTINQLPAAAGTITGPTVVCQGSTSNLYTVPVIANASGYVWSVPPGGTITAGSNTNSITVTYSLSASSGVVTVYGSSVCGNGPPAALIVTVNPIPGAAGTITGPASVCQGTLDQVYTVAPVAFATGYAWSLPAGAWIQSGNNTNSITVGFNPGAESGFIRVMGTNECGEGTKSSLYVQVTKKPPKPFIVHNFDGPLNVGDTVFSNATDGNQWYRNGEVLEGETKSYLVLHESGEYFVKICLSGCCSEESDQITLGSVGFADIGLNKFSVYPVPNDGLFKVAIFTTKPEQVRIYILSKFGQVFFELPPVTVNGEFESVVDIRPSPNGVYTIVFDDGEHKIIRKILINR